MVAGIALSGHFYTSDWMRQWMRCCRRFVRRGLLRDLRRERLRAMKKGEVSPALPHSHSANKAQCASTASSSRATMLVILMAGFTAGPAVSL